MDHIHTHVDKLFLAHQTHTTRKGLVACYTSVCLKKPYSYVYDNTYNNTKSILQISLSCVEKA